MGLISDLFGGLSKCLCGGGGGYQEENQQQQQQQRPPSQPAHVSVPPSVPHKPQTQQPAPIYPPQPHSQHGRPPPQEKPHEQGQEPKKHKKHEEHGPQSGGGAYTPHTPGRTTSPPPSSPPSRPWSPGRPDPNQANQHNEHYVALRARANAAGDEMGRSFDESHRAYESGDGARAKELSNAGKAAQREMERLNEEAAAWIFRENNTDSSPGEVDLHGLYVKEAIHYTEKSIEEARGRGDTEVRLIVGKGLHSTNHVAKLKPAIEDLMKKHGLIAQLDEQNPGVLIVSLDGHTKGKGPALGPDELTRGLEKKDECIIM